jgi:glyoxylase-like metal-dependent hydrolase (beta-lactamase superfamily II)
MGLPDVPPETPVFVGPGETEARAALNLFTRGTIDRMLERPGPLEAWVFDDSLEPHGNNEPLAVLDVFGDASLWALHAPGHTPGSMAFLVRTPEGPRLLVGDTSHTRWGWENAVEPGTFTADHERNAASLAALRDLAARHPTIRVHLGHQRLREGVAR